MDADNNNAVFCYQKRPLKSFEMDEPSSTILSSSMSTDAEFAANEMQLTKSDHKSANWKPAIAN